MKNRQANDCNYKTQNQKGASGNMSMFRMIRIVMTNRVALVMMVVAAVVVAAKVLER